MSRSSWAWICRASGTGLLRSIGICMADPTILAKERPSSMANWPGRCRPIASRIMPGQPTSAPGRTRPMGQMKEFAGVYYREGALDPKTMQLVALAAMAAAGCTS
ncbi:MAG: hypothetical protein DME08_21835 [Candidatus Rokuibacteriota bacterium]|nr:MAG: hypothetical protein DME08_21835 [Candidatus Rokubacteria bacterium]PYN61177.1 MAG: hypothetical protein DMD90_24485 [Candidatus Rokubacteria bacterium]PYN98468.1 MAG: hypothetical protein DMD89_13655 [Candidatus Rokubacteria bacterium]